MPEPFGPYRLETLLGAGGMGQVYRAFDTDHERVVAVKVMPPHLSGDEEYRRRFRQEAKVAAQLTEPHVVPVHRFGEIDGRLFLEMRLVEGDSLGDRLARGPLPPAEAVRIVEQVASALDAAHRAGLVHRDVKPGNVFLSHDSAVGGFPFAYLGDFGIARVLGATAESVRTALGTALGTTRYMAPERFLGPEIDGRADVYSLACMLYECLTGVAPFEGDEPAVLMHQHMYAFAPPPSLRGVPATLDAVVARGMAKRPDDRFPTAGALAAAAVEAVRVAGVADPMRTHAGHITSAPVGPGPVAWWSAQPDAGVPDAVVPAPRVPVTQLRATTGPDLHSGPRPPAGFPSHPATPGADPAGRPDVREGVAASIDAGPQQTGPPVSDGRPPERRRRRRIAAWTAAVVGVALAAGIGTPFAVAALTTGPTLRLDSVDTLVEGSFAPDFRTATTRLPGTVLASSRPDGDTAPTGEVEGLYRAERSVASCDRDGLTEYLSSRADLRSEWLRAIASDPAARPGTDTSSYVGTLTPVYLRSDVRTTEFRMDDGAAVPDQVVLQAGTAVLVDARGVPRVRCLGGNPLTAQHPLPGGATEEGIAWPGYSPAAALHIVPASTDIVQFGVLGLDDSAFRRPAGSSGEYDIDQVLSTAAMEGRYTVSGTLTSCDGFTDCSTVTPWSDTVEILDCTSDSCQIASFSGSWDGTQTLTRDGTSWRASGDLIGYEQFTCDVYDGNGFVPTPTSFSLSLTPSEAAVRDTVWSVSAMTAVFGRTFAASSPCLGGTTQAGPADYTG